MYGARKPEGVLSRLAVLDPTGNCETAEAARRALAVYAAELQKSSMRSLNDQGAEIAAWIMEETVAAETMRTISEVNC